MNLQQAEEWMATKMKAIDGRAVTYARGATSVAITVVVGATPITVSDTNGLLVESRIRDYQVLASDLAAFSPAKPERGDRITELTGEVFEVVPQAGEPASRMIDTKGFIWRAHTQRVTA